MVLSAVGKERRLGLWFCDREGLAQHVASESRPDGGGGLAEYRPWPVDSVCLFIMHPVLSVHSNACMHVCTHNIVSVLY